MSSSDSPSNGNQGVRNLRAKFEGQFSSSPPRGRSPVTSRHASIDGSDASQTRNTVRASFVPVEPIKPDMDDRKITPEACTGSTAHKRRESFSMDESTDFKAMAELRGAISSELERRRKTSLIEPVPEVAVVTPAIERGESELFPKMKKPIERPSGLSKQAIAGNDAIDSASSEDGDASGQTIEPADKPTSEDNTPSPEKKEDSNPTEPQKSKSPDQGKNAADEGKADVKEPTGTPASAGSKSVASPSTGGSSYKRNSGPSKISAPGSGSRAGSERTARTTSGSTSAKNTKLPVTPTLARKPSTKDGAKARPLSQIHKPEGQSTASASSATRARARTKSPTRPVKLPQSATAPTSSSAARTSTGSTLNGASRPGPARAPSGTTQNNDIRRQASKREQTKPGISKGALPSNVSGSRALPHRPVDSAVPKVQPSKAERNTSGEGFLARMMRPTLSSASKVHEKPTNVPKSGPHHERTTTGKPTQADKRKGEASSNKKPARPSGAGSEQSSEGREQASGNKNQVAKSKEQVAESEEHVSENKEQVSEDKEQISETQESHEEIAVDGNIPHSAKEEPAVSEDEGMAKEGQGEQVAEPTPA